MPNWCSTDYVFRGEENEIKDFYSKIKSFISKERIPNDFGDEWLGNIVDGFGFDWEEIRCKGYIDYLSELGEDGDYDRISLSTQTAWVPMTEMWDKIIAKYYPSITYVLIAEEPGFELYINTDLTGEDFSMRFSVDFKLPPKYKFSCDIGFYADCEEELVETFNSIFHRRYKCYKQCKKRLYKEFKKKEYRDKGYFIKIHKYRETLYRGLCTNIIVATSNLEKLKDFKFVNKKYGYGFNILSMSDCGINIDVEENGESYRENAFIKAKSIYGLVPKSTSIIADDCGYELEHLNNEPGIYSKRYLGDVSFEDKLKHILDRMSDVTELQQRVMHRIGCIVCIFGENVLTESYSIQGYCDFAINTNGLGQVRDSTYSSDADTTYPTYSDIFYLPQFNKVASDLTVDEWNEVNPRIAAIKQIYDELLDIR